MDELATLNTLGLELPSPAYLFGLILFGLLGLAAYRYGKKNGRPQTRWLGLALMLYPYLISQTWQLYAIGGGLCAALYFWRR